jgi:hypothetical protein
MLSLCFSTTPRQTALYLPARRLTTSPTHLLQPPLIPHLQHPLTLTATANALAHGSGQAYANADASEGRKKTKSREVAQSASHGSTVSASKRVDHLGIES